MCENWNLENWILTLKSFLFKTATHIRGINLRGLKKVEFRGINFRAWLKKLDFCGNLIAKPRNFLPVKISDIKVPIFLILANFDIWNSPKLVLVKICPLKVRLWSHNFTGSKFLLQPEISRVLIIIIFKFSIKFNSWVFDKVEEG